MKVYFVIAFSPYDYGSDVILATLNPDTANQYIKKFDDLTNQLGAEKHRLGLDEWTRQDYTLREDELIEYCRLDEEISKLTKGHEQLLIKELELI